VKHLVLAGGGHAHVEVTGHYDWQQCHIDLGRLCGRAGAELVQAQVAAVDPEARTIALDNGRTTPGPRRRVLG
jgi:NADH dehydrogenase FAD-containing subunit